MRLNLETIYNVVLLALTLEEIATIIYSAFNRSFANISLQIYQTLILIGNIGFIINLLQLNISIFGRYIFNKKCDINTNNIFIIAFDIYIIYSYFLYK